MYEVHVVLPENRVLYLDHLEKMFQQRYEVFINILGWEVPGTDHPNQREIDAYDLPNTIYLLVLRGHQLVGASRMLPTTGPTMMGDIFPDLCEKGVPNDPQIWEWSRGHVKPDEPHQNRSTILNHIFLSGYEFAFNAGLKGLTAQVNVRELDRWLSRGLVVDLLGQPKRSGQEEVLAMQHHISQQTLARVRHGAGLSDRVLRLTETNQDFSLTDKLSA